MCTTVTVEYVWFPFQETFGISAYFSCSSVSRIFRKSVTGFRFTISQDRVGLERTVSLECRIVNKTTLVSTVTVCVVYFTIFNQRDFRVVLEQDLKDSVVGLVGFLYLWSHVRK